MELCQTGKAWGLDKVEPGERVGQNPGGAEDGEIESEFCPMSWIL
jgi:hypothetical protein